ncbi:MAG TPA: pyridoxamine 5'-phosphate oxidase family protein [Candidatus Saccharimonadales bacterium]|nr:pyridoxamine 5'-phosphate oxidase family protein [Candidatus Saccharimonadales bacterium]
MAFSDKAAKFLAQVKMGVISSIGPDGAPQSAYVGVTTLFETGELMVGTSVKTRKYANLKANPKSSITMWEGATTIQTEGAVEIIERGDSRFADYEGRILKVDPSKQRFVGDSDQIWMVFKPTWIRYTDIAAKPWVIEENKY